MKKLMMMAVLALGIVSAAASAETKYGYSPYQCNSTEGVVTMEICHSGSVSLSTTVGARVSGGGLEGSMSTTLTGTVTESSCTNATVPAGKCVQFKYEFSCYWEYESSFWPFGGKWVKICDYLGSELICTNPLS